MVLEYIFVEIRLRVREIIFEDDTSFVRGYNSSADVSLVIKNTDARLAIEDSTDESPNYNIIIYTTDHNTTANEEGNILLTHSIQISQDQLTAGLEADQIMDFGGMVSISCFTYRLVGERYPQQKNIKKNY